jgi:signal transduction histidine kinase
MAQLSALQLKFRAENVVFISIISIVAVLVIFFVMHRRSVHIIKELDKVTELIRHGRYSAGDYLKRLGRIGDKIDDLMFELNHLNDMKSLKISSLTAIIQFLVENIHLRLIICDIQGNVLHCSARLLVDMGVERSFFINKKVGSLVEKIEYEEILRKLGQSRSPVLRENLKIITADKSLTSSVEFYPVFNVKNELSNVMFIAENKSVLSGLSKKADQITTTVTKAQRKITDIFKKKKQ